MKNSDSARVGIIGGGLGGLAAACTLAARGYSVILLERNNWLGGKAARLEEQGYRFDMGPTILTMPSVLRHIFSEAGQQIENHLELIRLDPQWRCFFADGSVLDLRQSAATMAHELASFSPQSGSAEAYRRFLDLSERMNAISQQFFFWRSVGSVWDIVDRRSILQPSLLRALFDMRPGRSVSATVRSHVSDAARRSNARPLHPVRRFRPGPIPGSTLWYRPHTNK